MPDCIALHRLGNIAPPELRAPERRQRVADSADLLVDRGQVLPHERLYERPTPTVLRTTAQPNAGHSASVAGSCATPNRPPTKRRWVTAPVSMSVVSAPYVVDGQVVGTLGVIGPTRMAYDRMIQIVDITSRLVSNALSQK